MEKLKEHKENLQKWIRTFRKLCDKCERTFRVNQLIEKVMKHIWIIEWRVFYAARFNKKLYN